MRRILAASAALGLALACAPKGPDRPPEIDDVRRPAEEWLSHEAIRLLRDYVRIDNVGAYTIVMSPTFIHPAPAIVLGEADGFRAVRRRQSFEQAFANYQF